MIESIIVEESLEIMNEGAATHYHVQTNKLSSIDLSLCSVDAIGQFGLETDSDLHGSDHFPLYLKATNFLPQRGPPRWLTKKADWASYSTLTAEIEKNTRKQTIGILQPNNR